MEYFLSPPSGILQAVQIQVHSDRNHHPNNEYNGIDFWHLAVVITPPGQRKAVQVGGSHWLGGTDVFYFRLWPDMRASIYSSDNFTAARDVSAAALTGEYPPAHAPQRSLNQESWTVELILGSNYRDSTFSEYGM